MRCSETNNLMQLPARLCGARRSAFSATARRLAGVGIAVAVVAPAVAAAEPDFPVEPVVFADEPFQSCEGLSFNGEGVLYATCNQALWSVSTTGEAAHVADVGSNLGVAGVGARDLYVADFGPTNAFSGGRNSDGVVWRITPEGEKRAHATGIGDPNVILVQGDGGYLVSDDATSDIYRVDPDGAVSLYSTAVNHPNGIVFSLDGSRLYVAQMFDTIRPVVGVGKLWSLEIGDGQPVGGATMVADAGPGAFVDGIALDRLGRVYVTANRKGQIWRYDPGSGDMTLVCEGVFGAASIVFGEGGYDRESVFVTTTFSDGRGGKIWRIPVGVEGAPVVR